MAGFGAPGKPVKLDPWQMITEVHWPDDGQQFLYLNQGVFTLGDASGLHSYSSYVVAKVFGAADFTIRNGELPVTHTYNGRTIIKEQITSGYSVGTNPAAADANISGNWSVIDLVELRLAYPELTTIDLDYYFGAQSSPGTVPADYVGPWAHLVTGEYTYWDFIGAEPAYYLPWEMARSGLAPLNNPDLTIDTSSKTTVAGSSVPVVATPTPPTFLKLRTLRYNDELGTITLII
jgi:hypothetical protein